MLKFFGWAWVRLRMSRLKMFKIRPNFRKRKQCQKLKVLKNGFNIIALRGRPGTSHFKLTTNLIVLEQDAYQVKELPAKNT